MQDQLVTPTPQWQFQPEQPEEPMASDMPQGQSAVQWTASEFMSHQKNGKWYMVLFGGALVASILLYLITRDVISSVTLMIVAVLLAIVAARKPRTLSYSLTEVGLQIGDRLYPYHDFKSFSVINEGAINSIMLLPIKRFAPAVNMYYAPEDEQKIVDALSASLPYEERKQDPVDKFMQRIRF